MHPSDHCSTLNRRPRAPSLHTASCVSSLNWDQTLLCLQNVASSWECVYFWNEWWQARFFTGDLRAASSAIWGHKCYTSGTEAEKIDVLFLSWNLLGHLENWRLWAYLERWLPLAQTLTDKERREVEGDGGWRLWQTWVRVPHWVIQKHPICPRRPPYLPQEKEPLFSQFTPQHTRKKTKTGNTN